MFALIHGVPFLIGSYQDITQSLGHSRKKQSHSFANMDPGPDEQKYDPDKKNMRIYEGARYYAEEH